jgi:hypothetical protein
MIESYGFLKLKNVQLEQFIAELWIVYIQILSHLAELNGRLNMNMNMLKTIKFFSQLLTRMELRDILMSLSLQKLNIKIT